MDRVGGRLCVCVCGGTLKSVCVEIFLHLELDRGQVRGQLGVLGGSNRVMSAPKQYLELLFLGKAPRAAY